ncbi:MAG: type II toxin-antitoxin system VapB family antitoxin [Candidatus Devosia phytovorans]|uniref:Type II toxin-antitoxin system VapB family antitoxin n=1 Tax=Candidatus Devosia phytovorans TaxID=3121372 RepID=A0AAJ6B2E0_9HYPH|nr:type II toxin-antitoxin system VapB family antitoxin [Devosia sp.]WEK06606.1 MAG: type II toxin-antitoxin system VapB family antitoxin [Devosia sp.]
MKTTVTIDAELVADAKKITGISETGLLIEEALQSLLREEAARSLIEMGGTMPQLEDIPRSRQDIE